MIDHRTVKLGKAAPKNDHRNLKLAKYLTAALPPPPPSCDWTAKVTSPWGMMLNDALGDCTIAGAGHLIMCWTGNAGVLVVPPDSAIEAAYESIDGYVAGDQSTDNGGVEVDVLNAWRQDGIAGHKIGGWAQVGHRNHQHVMTGVALFGGLYIGVALPVSFQGAAIWDVLPGGAVGDGAAGSWGGHCVVVVKYDEKGVYVVSWGELIFMTWAAWDAYVDEAYAIVSPDWLVEGAATPAGVDASALAQDLASVTN